MNEIEARLNVLSNDTTIPLEVGEAFKSRVLEGGKPVIISGTSATAHNKTVNEGGVASYSVMDKPNGFMQVVFKGTMYVIPYF